MLTNRPSLLALLVLTLTLLTSTPAAAELAAGAHVIEGVLVTDPGGGIYDLVLIRAPGEPTETRLWLNDPMMTQMELLESLREGAGELRPVGDSYPDVPRSTLLVQVQSPGDGQATLLGLQTSTQELASEVLRTWRARVRLAEDPADARAAVAALATLERLGLASELARAAIRSTR